MHGLLVARVADDDLAEPRLQIVERLRKAEDRHDFGGDDDVEAVLARKAVARAAQRHGDVAQRAVVHVHHALPRDAPHVDAERVAVVDVIVEERGEQVVGDADRVKVAGEVQVDVFHRHHLRIAAARGAALHAEDRTERRLAQADRRLLADLVQAVAEPHRGRRLALARRRRADRRHQDELAVRSSFEPLDPVERDLRLGAAIGHERIGGRSRGARRCPRWAAVSRAGRSRYRSTWWILRKCASGCFRNGRATTNDAQGPADRVQMTGFAPPSMGTMAPVT